MSCCLDERNNLESKLRSLLSWVANLEQLCVMDLGDDEERASAVVHQSRSLRGLPPGGSALRFRRPASLESASARRSPSPDRYATSPDRRPPAYSREGLSSSRLQADLDAARRTLSRVSALLLESERSQDVAASANRALTQDLEAARRRISLLELRRDRDRPDSTAPIMTSSSTHDMRHQLSPAPNSERARRFSNSEKLHRENLLLSDKCQSLERQVQGLQKEILDANVLSSSFSLSA